MPCYNAAATLDEAVGSILEQTLTDLELVVVDDGSQDGTADLLDAWRRRDRRVRVQRQAHTGIVAALNAGLAACRAPLVARMDADDRSHPERLEAQLNFLDQEPAIAVAGCLVEAFPPEQVRRGFEIYLEWLNRLTTPEAIARELFIESPLPHPSVMVRRQWLERVGGYADLGWPEDYDLWLRLHLYGARFAKVERWLLSWREDPGRLTRTDPRYSVENFLRAKAHYLARGPLLDREAVILWGAGQMGRRLSKHLLREGVPITAFIDIDPKKIGRTRRGRAIHAPDDLPNLLARHSRPVVLAAVGARGGRRAIRTALERLDLIEGEDWWAVA